jgi:hypothetical protein
MPEPPTEPAPTESESSLLGYLGCIPAIAAIVGLHLLAVWTFGLWGHPATGWQHLAIGAVLTALVIGVFVLVGESLIEDVVKFVMVAVLTWVTWRSTGPVGRTIVVGMPLGAALVVLMKLAYNARERRSG